MMQGLSKGLSAKIPVLSEGNYENWAVRMRQLLTVQRLWKYVAYGPTGAEPTEPAKVKKEGDPTVKAEDALGDEETRAWILLYVKDEHMPAMGRMESAKQLWDHLRSVYMANVHATRVYS